METVLPGGCSEDEAITLTASGEEASFVFRCHGVPEGFELQVIEYIGKAALESLDFMGEWLLEVEKGARGLPCTRSAKRRDPYVGCVEIFKEIGGVTGVYGGE